MPAVLVGILELLLLVLMALWLVRSITTRPVEIVQLQVTQIGRGNMADKLVYNVTADVPAAADVVARVLTVAIDGVENASQFGSSVTDFGAVTVVEGASVVLTLVDVDNAGNRSEPASVSFVAADTLPPGQPGGFGVTLVGEIADQVAAPVEPAIEPEVPAVEPEAPAVEIEVPVEAVEVPAEAVEVLAEELEAPAVDVAPEVPADEPAPEVDPNA